MSVGTADEKKCLLVKPKKEIIKDLLDERLSLGSMLSCIVQFMWIICDLGVVHVTKCNLYMKRNQG